MKQIMQAHLLALAKGPRVVPHSGGPDWNLQAGMSENHSSIPGRICKVQSPSRAGKMIGISAEEQDKPKRTVCAMQGVALESHCLGAHSALGGKHVQNPHHTWHFDSSTEQATQRSPHKPAQPFGPPGNTSQRFRTRSSILPDPSSGTIGGLLCS